MQEQKYFISYVGYIEGGGDTFLNDIIFIDEEITSELIQDIQDSLLNKLNEERLSNPYFATQIINIVKL